jgi:hypothetical protein
MESKPSNVNKAFRSSIAGAGAGVVCTILCAPLDVVSASTITVIIFLNNTTLQY